MTVFYLVRHALHEYGGHRIAGRTPGVNLSSDGVRQAVDLATRTRGLPFSAIYTSPLDRTRQTAAAIGEVHGLAPIVEERLVELDFGEWTGQELTRLQSQPRWTAFNAFRSGSRALGGELMPETQLRIVQAMTELAKRHPSEHVALVSHGDLIKSAVAYWLGVPLDLFQRIEISCASVSVVALAEFGPWVLGINHTGDIPGRELPA